MMHSTREACTALRRQRLATHMHGACQFAGDARSGGLKRETPVPIGFREAGIARKCEITGRIRLFPPMEGDFS